MSYSFIDWLNFYYRVAYLVDIETALFNPVWKCLHTWYSNDSFLWYKILGSHFFSSKNISFFVLSCLLVVRHLASLTPPVPNAVLSSSPKNSFCITALHYLSWIHFHVDFCAFVCSYLLWFSNDHIHFFILSFFFSSFLLNFALFFATDSHFHCCYSISVDSNSHIRSVMAQFRICIYCSYPCAFSCYTFSSQCF